MWFQCLECAEEFNTRSALDTHEYRPHLYPCNECNLKFQDEPLWRDHKDWPHLLPCDRCDLKFVDKYQMHICPPWNKLYLRPHGIGLSLLVIVAIHPILTTKPFR